MFSTILFLALFGSSFAFLFHDEPKWNSLKVTWGANPFNSNYFDKMPRTTKDAEKAGFQKISDCDAEASFRGTRYVLHHDNVLVLLYDVNGYIAGIQLMIPTNQPNGYPPASLQPPYIKDGDNYLLTAYFVDPSIICTSGRKASDFETQGTGTNLYIQNGTSPESDSILIPYEQKGMKGTKWTLGKCFPTMGVHYWYDTSRDMDCDNFFPVFLMYNRGKLTGFGWSTAADLKTTRFEHPPTLALRLFFKTVPKCLVEAKVRSTMHIYLNGNVLSDLC